tara:strand:- start:4478 stop:6727 length:2250 start_codon:yes stop_codon:yes gene_type:complete
MDADHPLEIDGLELDSLNEKGKPVETRLKNVKSAIAIFMTLAKADEKSAVNRARVDAMFDGAAPYNQGSLLTSGQPLKTNLNFGEAQRLLDIALSAYVDLYSSLECLVEVTGTTGEKSEIAPQEAIVADELTHLMRSWPEFHSAYLRLCTTFIKHGVSIAYFDTPDDWKFRVGGFSDILIPRQTPASESCIDIAIGRREYLLHELYAFVKNPDAAAKVGWDVDEVKRVIAKNASTKGRGDKSAFDNYEILQQEMKNNDIHAGMQNPSVSVLHFWVKEMDGTVSHYMAAENMPKEFLYKKVSRYENAEQAYVMFNYGVGSNGTYHSVRGLGQRIFSHVQTSNRLRCQQIDGAMLASAVMIQPENQRSLDELQFTYYGAYAVMSPNVKIVEKAIPNLGTAVQPALQDITEQLQLNTDTVSTYGPTQGSPYRNQMQITSDADVTTRLSGASLNLFYASWTRLLREVVRRVVTTKKRDGALKDFVERCAKRGVGPDFIKSLDLNRTKAVRSIGNGSYANRMVALKELQGISGQFDDVGRRNLTRDIVSTRVGHDLADRYVSPDVEKRPTVDVKIAFFENQQLQEGNSVPVIANELHGTHLEVHVPLLNQIIEALNTGEASPQQVLPMLQSLYQHISETAQHAAGDPALEGLVGQTKQVLQYAEEAINNTMKALQKIQRDQAKEGEGEALAEEQQMDQDQQEGDEQSVKMQEHEIKMQIAQEKANLDMAIKQKKHEQEMAIRDAKAALEFRENA